MTTTICWFLICLLFSMGISINADNLGDGLAQIIDEAITTGNYECSEEEIMSIKDYIDASPIASDYVLTEDDIAKLNTYIPSDVIEEAVGIDAWKDFVSQHTLNYGDSITSSDGYTLTFFTDIHPSYDEETGRYNYYVMWYEITDPNGTVIKRDAFFNNTIYSLGDEADAAIALDNSYIDEDQRFHILRCDGSQMAVVDCATLFPSGMNPNFAQGVIDGATIGIIEGANGTLYEIGADGAIVLPDGSVVYPNEDGSYTINNTNYYPTEYNLAAYDDSALLGLLQQVLARLDSIENALEFESEEDIEAEKDEELEAAQEEALEEVESYEGTLKKYTYSSPKWTTIFPFCIPWDFVRGVKLVSAAPVAPKFSIPFEIPAFLSFPGYKTEIVLDFSDFEKYFVPVRWFTTVFFLMSLGFVTFKIVKGAA